MRVQKLGAGAGLLALVTSLGCVAEPKADGDETETSGDGDGDPSGDGDGDPSGDGNGDPSGDGDGEPSGDGDGDGFEGWCSICVDPVDNGACGVVANSTDNAWFAVETDGYKYTIDETCTVTSASPNLVELACADLEPTITLNLATPWVPNLSTDESVRVRADGYESEWGWVVSWRVDHSDDSLAIAGEQAYNGVSSIGYGAAEGTMVHQLCTPSCGRGTVMENIAVQFGEGDDQATLFTGGHAVVGDLEVWTPKVQRLACDEYGDSGIGYVIVFVSPAE